MENPDLLKDMIRKERRGLKEKNRKIQKVEK